MKILVFMSDNRPLEKIKHNAGYNSLVAAINYEYCKKHNYNFVYYRPYLNDINDVKLHNCIDPNTKTLRHAAWSKLLVSKSILEEQYDYIVYIDSDCIFKDFNHKLEDLINRFNNPIIFLNNKPWGNNVPCSGFYILKVCDYTKKFVNDWYNTNEPTFNKKHAWEQDALWKIFNKYNIVIVDSWMFRETEGQFLRHVGCCEDNPDPNYRVNYFINYIDKYNINYELNIDTIKCIDFDTIKCIDFDTNINSILFDNHSIINKSYSWCNNDNKITFLENNEMNAFGWGYYNKINNNIYIVYFGGRKHILVFNKDYTEFVSTRVDDLEIVKGYLLK